MEPAVDELMFAALRAALGCAPAPVVDDSHLRAAVLAQARAERVHGLVATQVRVQGGPFADRREELRRALVLQRDVVAVDRALAGAAIPHVFWKGTITDAQFFGGQGLRACNDVDVVVPRALRGVAIASLRAIGWRLWRDPAHRVSSWTHRGTDLVHDDAASHHPVDLHAPIIASPPYRPDEHGLFARAVVVPTAFGPLPSPSGADHLVALAGNLGAGHLVGRVRLAVDAACLLRGPIDEEVVVRSAHAQGVATSLWGLLRLVDVRFGIDRPGLRVALQPRALVRALVERAYGVHAPAADDDALRALWLVETPLAGRASWPLHAGIRRASLRVADSIAARVPDRVAHVVTALIRS